jgi:hypothetical protein
MSISTYAEYQELETSRKIGLVVQEVSRQLVGWVLDSGSTYKLENFEHSVIVSIEDSGVLYTEVSSVATVGATPGSWYLDRDAKTLYLQASDSSNPNSRFLALTFKEYYANSAINAPHDLSTGFDVSWLPLLRTTSAFGVELDNQRSQLGFAVEGRGSVTYINDKDYWVSRFDKFTWEGGKTLVYSWNKELPITEAKLIYRGTVQAKSYSESDVSFQLRDFLNDLRANIELDTLGDLVDATASASFKRSLQRQVYGKINGFRPQNIDQSVFDVGYELVGTVSSVTGNNTINCSGTEFTQDLRKDDVGSFDYVNDLLINTSSNPF